MAEARQTVGIIGAGVMGSAYAHNLVAHGDRVVAYDVDPQRNAAAVEFGCDVVADVAAMLREQPGIIVVALASDLAFALVMEHLALGIAGAAGARIQLPVVVDTSTLALATKEDGRDLLASAGMTLLDCPVSGTGAQALARDLVMFASGPQHDVDRCLPALQTIARDVRRVGEFGTGSQMKFLANLLVIVHTAAAAEMLALAARAGIDPAIALDTIGAGAGQSRMLDLRGPQMVRRSEELTASVNVFRKDLDIIEDFARRVGAVTPLLSTAGQLFEQAESAGWGERDVTAVHDVYRSQPDERATDRSRLRDLRDVDDDAG